MMNENTLLPYKKREISLTAQSVACMQLGGLNPLISAAMPLLLLIIKLRRTHSVDSERIVTLRSQVIHEVMAFIESTRKFEYPTRIRLAAQYCLCTALDEVVLATEWGNNSIWSHQTLLSTMQKETWGGDRFFIILEEMAKLPEKNIDLLELLYLILSLGFEGRYYNQQQAVREQIRQQLFYSITLHQKEPEKLLSPSLTVSQQVKKISSLGFSRWKVLALGMSILIGSWISFNAVTWLTSHEILQSFLAIKP